MSLPGIENDETRTPAELLYLIGLAIHNNPKITAVNIVLHTADQYRTYSAGATVDDCIYAASAILNDLTETDEN